MFHTRRISYTRLRTKLALQVMLGDRRHHNKRVMHNHCSESDARSRMMVIRKMKIKEYKKD